MVISVKKLKPVNYVFFRTADVKLEHLFEHPVAACNYNALRICLKRRLENPDFVNPYTICILKF